MLLFTTSLITFYFFTMKTIFLDMETTGLDPLVHRPIDVALKIVDVASNRVVADYQSLIFQPEAVWDKHDPISLQINGYKRSDLTKGKEPLVVKNEIVALFQELQIQRGQAVFICQNPAFDRAFFIQLIDVYTQERLNWPYHWLDLASMYWVLLVQNLAQQGLPFPEEVSLSKNSIAHRYGLSEEKSPHRAMQGVDHLIACYRAVLTKKSDGLSVSPALPSPAKA